MAKETDQGSHKVVSVSRKEAADLAGLLIAQLADVPLEGHHAGACPTLRIVDDGKIKYLLSIVLEPSN